MDLSVILFLIIGFVGLVIGGELLVRGASKLASALGIPAVIIGLTVVAFGTSAPELAVSLHAAVDGNADISVSNIVGSNIFNVLFILGASALISPLVIHSKMISREIPVMFGATVLLWLFAFDGDIGPIEGFVLFGGVISYTCWLIYEALQDKASNQNVVEEAESKFPPEENTAAVVVKSLALVIVGLGVIMYGADKLVDGATILARSLGVSDTVIGLTIVAIGTSLPEVVASIMATLKGERDIAVGNVVGSNIFNILSILGITGIITRLKVNESLLSFDIPVATGVAVLCWLAFARGRLLSRWEGGIFLALYIGYTYLLIQKATA